VRLRQIDGVLGLGWVHQELAAYCSHTGRPSIDPVLMIRMLIIGYVVCDPLGATAIDPNITAFISGLRRCGDLSVDHGQKRELGGVMITRRTWTSSGPLQKARVLIIGMARCLTGRCIL
jgi:hypothetical protein